MTTSPVLAIHGGAGTLRPETMTEERRKEFHAGLRRSLLAGYRVLAAGGPALDVVTAAVMALEDDPLFNAGHGAAFTSAGTLEMDAAVMDGATRAAGAVTGICGPRNPVLAARAVMERTEHVMLAGSGAMAFCRDQGLEFADEAYFRTDWRWDTLQKELTRRTVGEVDMRDDAMKHGTVGAVACDAAGHLAAATSTGGSTAKLPGRVGDSPIFGAGTFADDATCAVSCTGHGEFFMRYVVAHEISARMKYLNESLGTAADHVVASLGCTGGSGGLVAVDRAGNVALPFNSAGMYRGTIGSDGMPRTAIYAEALVTG